VKKKTYWRESTTFRYGAWTIGICLTVVILGNILNAVFGIEIVPSAIVSQATTGVGIGLILIIVRARSLAFKKNKISKGDDK